MLDIMAVTAATFNFSVCRSGVQFIYFMYTAKVKNIYILYMMIILQSRSHKN